MAAALAKAEAAQAKAATTAKAAADAKATAGAKAAEAKAKAEEAAAKEAKAAEAKAKADGGAAHKPRITATVKILVEVEQVAEGGGAVAVVRDPANSLPMGEGAKATPQGGPAARRRCRSEGVRAAVPR